MMPSKASLIASVKMNEPATKATPSTIANALSARRTLRANRVRHVILSTCSSLPYGDEPDSTDQVVDRLREQPRVQVDVGQRGVRAHQGHVVEGRDQHAPVGHEQVEVVVEVVVGGGRGLA